MTDTTNTPVEWPKNIDAKTLEEIISIIAKEGMVEPSMVTPDATLDSLGLASVDVVMILMSVEEKLGIYVPIDNELAETNNLADFINTITKPKSDEGSPQDSVSE